MKTFLTILITLLCISVGGYFGYQFLKTHTGQSAGTFQTQSIIQAGVIQKLATPGDDYTHMLKTDDKLIKLNSYSVSLDTYVNKTVTVKGQYSGNTLFVDSVTSE